LANILEIFNCVTIAAALAAKGVVVIRVVSVIVQRPATTLDNEASAFVGSTRCPSNKLPLPTESAQDAFAWTIFLQAWATGTEPVGPVTIGKPDMCPGVVVVA
jgi:hypothetical protein